MDIESIEIKRDLRIIFMGTPDFSVPILQSLIDNYKVKAVVTQPDKVVGREGKIIFSPIKQLAYKNNIVVLQPEKIRESYEEIIELEPDLIVTCAYGQILPKELLDYPEYGCINVHASLLPKLRGGAPIHRAIMNGEKETGITIMHMDVGMDDGDIISQVAIPITMTETASSLHDKLSVLGSQLLIQTLPSIIDKTSPRVKQDPSLVTLASVIKPADEKIDFSKSSIQVYNKIRGLNSFPGAYCLFKGKRMKIFGSIIKEESYPTKINGEIVKLYDEGFGVKTGNGVIVITLLQLEGKKVMSAKDFINGYQNQLVGNVLE